MKIFPQVRRIFTTVAGGGAGFIASVVKPALEFTTQLRLIGSTVLPGVKFEQAPTAFVGDPIEAGVATSLLGATGSATAETIPAIGVSAAPGDLGRLSEPSPAVAFIQSLRSMLASETTKPGIAASLVGATGDAAKVATNPALAVSPAPSSAVVVEDSTPAVDIVQIKYDLTRRVGSDAVTEYAVNARTDFDTPANAQGIHDGVLCTCASAALGARSGGLQFAYADSVSKGDLTITQVNLHFYTAKPANALGGTLVHQYRLGSSGAWTVLATHTSTVTAAFDFLTTPETFDITAAIAGLWSNVDAVQASVEANIPTLSSRVDVDAVELEIIATATQTV